MPLVNSQDEEGSLVSYLPIIVLGRSGPPDLSPQCHPLTSSSVNPLSSLSFPVLSVPAATP